MNRSISLYIVLIVFFALALAGCEIFRTEEQAQDDIREFFPPAIVQTEPIVRLKPATQQLNPGEATTVDILVENVFDLYGAEIELEFEPTILQVLDANSGVDGVQISPGNFLSSDFVVRNEADNALGRVIYVVVQVDPAPPANGNGVLASFTVQAVALGESDLIFSAPVKLSDPTGQPILAEVEESIISVGGAAPPTMSPEPTQPPATTTVPPVAEHGAELATVTPVTPAVVDTPALVPTAAITASPPVTLAVPAAPVQPLPTETPVPPPPLPTPIRPLTLAGTPVLKAKIPHGATVGFCYRVQAGDTLESIAKQFNSSVKGIQLANDLVPPGHIYLHQALFVPKRMGKGPNVYIVRAGDTLAAIGDACNQPVDMLTWVNKLEVGAEVSEGQVLEIPIPPFPPPSRFPYPPSVYPPPYASPP